MANSFVNQITTVTSEAFSNINIIELETSCTPIVKSFYYHQINALDICDTILQLKLAAKNNLKNQDVLYPNHLHYYAYLLKIGK